MWLEAALAAAGEIQPSELRGEARHGLARACGEPSIACQPQVLEAPQPCQLQHPSICQSSAAREGDREKDEGGQKEGECVHVAVMLRVSTAL